VRNRFVGTYRCYRWWVSRLRPSPRAAVAIIVAIAVAVVVGGTLVGNAQTPPPSLAPLSAEQLLSKLITTAETSAPPSFSGDASSSVNLGLPQIPTGLGGTSATGGLTDLLTGDQTYKVWHSPDGVRVANLLPAGERDLVANKTDAWLWDSQTQTAKHLTYDLAAMRAAAKAQQRSATPPDPSTLATTIVRRVAPYADLSVSSTQWVAGEPTYTLVLTPTSSTTLVGSVQVALDANNWVPLQLEVFAKGSDSAAIRVGFTSISFGPVDASTFDFTPPAGATVTTTALPTRDMHRPDDDAAPEAGPLTFGTGFDTVVAFPLTSPVPQEAEALLPYSGPLASVTVAHTASGTWVLAGAVPVSELQATVPKLP
jgi:outer membrane lipoprotein-sorting protein